MFKFNALKRRKGYTMSLLLFERIRCDLNPIENQRKGC